MNEAEDHVLEFALGELHGRSATDLPERVLRELRKVQPVGARPGPRTPQPVAPRVWMAAAAVAVVCLSLFLVLRRGGQTTPRSLWVATSADVLGVLRQGEREARLLDAFLPGETLVNGPERERIVALTSGETIRMGQCSMLTLEHDERGLVIAPQLGRITLQASEKTAVRFRTRLGTLAMGAPGAVQVELRADGYDLLQPERFQQLAQELHMKTAVPLVLTLVTLLQGTAVLESAVITRQLVAGETVSEQQTENPANPIKRKLLEEAGTWDLTVTNVAHARRPAKPQKGLEVCRAGPGGEWLLTDLSIGEGEDEVRLHTVVGFNTRTKMYTGTLVDNFGGEMGLLRGTPEEDLDCRTLSMFSAEGTPGFDVRWVMRWESPDRRVTEFEALKGEEWIPIRKIVHERRK